MKGRSSRGNSYDDTNVSLFGDHFESILQNPAFFTLEFSKAGRKHQGGLDVFAGALFKSIRYPMPRNQEDREIDVVFHILNGLKAGLSPYRILFRMDGIYGS